MTEAKKLSVDHNFMTLYPIWAQLQSKSFQINPEATVRISWQRQPLGQRQNVWARNLGCNSIAMIWDVCFIKDAELQAYSCNDPLKVNNLFCNPSSYFLTNSTQSKQRGHLLSTCSGYYCWKNPLILLFPLLLLHFKLFNAWNILKYVMS